MFVEEMIPVRVYCTEKNIEQIIEHTMSYYNQEAVMAYQISSHVKIKHKKL